jgi:hypothetical protein
MQAMVSLRRHYGTTTPPLWYHYDGVVENPEWFKAVFIVKLF